jgi:hypothetical protein
MAQKHPVSRVRILLHRAVPAELLEPRPLGLDDAHDVQGGRRPERGLAQNLRVRRDVCIQGTAASQVRVALAGVEC